MVSGSGGFSSANPLRARGPQVDAKTYTRIYGGGGSRRSRPAPSPTVRVDGNTVFIDGQGFSVAPALQAEFIRNRTGGSGSSAQEAIRVAQENFERMERQRVAQQQAQAEKLRIEQLKRAVAMRDMSVLERQKLTQEINRRTQNLIQQSRNIGQKAVGVYDFLSGGSVTEKRIFNKQQQLNKEVENFNQEFGSRELSDSEFEKAQAKEKRLAQQQKKIDDDYNKLAKSFKSKVIGRIIDPLNPRVSLAEQSLKQNRLVVEGERELKRMKNELANTNSKYKKATLPRLIKAQERELLRYKAGGKPIVLTGDLPIIPLKSIPTKIASVKFAGTQRTLKDGRVVVNIAYKTNAGRVGKAQGIVKPVGDKQSVGIVRGNSARRFFKSPTKTTLRRKESFIGVEKSISSPGVLKLKNNLGGTTTVGKAKVINQLSSGRVITKGTRRPFVKSIGQFKIKPKLDIQDFVSLSKSLTVKDLSFIAGQSITSQKAKAKFVGIIKNLDRSGTAPIKFTVGEGRQISSAVTKLVNSMLGSISASQKATQGLSAGQKLAVATSALKTIANNPRVFTPKVLRSPQLVEQKLLETIKTTQVLAPKQKAKSRSIQNNLSRQNTKVKQLTKQLTQTRSKSKQQNIQKQINRIKQQQKTGLKQLQRLKQAQKLQMARPRMTVTTRTVPRKIGFFALKIPKGFTSKTLPKAVPTFYVVEKVRGKFKKLYPKPLTMRDAKDFAVYSIDNRLSRTAFFVPLGKAKTVVRPPKPIQDYASRNSQKVRPYRIRFGKRKLLVNGYIEKRRFFTDTPGERSALSRLKSSRPKRQMRRKISPSQRKELLQRLARARAVRMRNLRRRK